jgi:cell division protein FtsA
MRKSLINQKNILTAIDIGTTKVACLIAEGDPHNGNLHVLGAGQYASKGLSKGIITDMEATETAVLNAVHAAEKAAGLTIQDVVVNVSGSHLVSEIISLSMPIGGRIIGEEDVRTLLSQVTTLEDSRDFEVIHALPINYKVDDHKDIQDPCGMLGSHLSGTLHVITGSQGPVNNLVSCISRCHLTLRTLVSSPLASGFSNLVEDERDLGVTIIDIGGGTADIAIFIEGMPLFTDSVPLGGRHITNDLAHGLSTSRSQAERIKTLYGSAVETGEDDRTIVTVPQLGDTNQGQALTIKRGIVTAIIKPRMEEILEVIKSRLEKNDMYRIAGRRVVLTGGCSQLPGIRDLASQILGKQVRLGRPLKLSGMSDLAQNPSFSTCAGLLFFALRDLQQGRPASMEGSSWVKSAVEWVKENF